MHFDTRVFYPRASSYRSRFLTSIYRQLEKTKKGEYGERVAAVEHGSFTSMVFSACGGMGMEATVVIKKIADALATKHGESYSKVVTRMRCRLAYSLARSAIRCIWGSCSTHRRLPHVPPVDLVWAETAMAS